MFNYKSVFQQSLNEPIVVSFNKANNKNYRFGFTINQESSNYDRSVVVLEDNIHWKSPLIKEISTYKNDGLTYLYNCGNKIYNENLYIMSDPYSQTIDTSSKLIKKQVFGLQTSYHLHENLNFSEIDTKHSAYVTFSKSDYTPTDNDTILNNEDKTYLKKDYIVNPITLETSNSFVNSYIVDTESYVLVLSYDEDDITFIISDYEIQLDPLKEKVSSIVTFEDTQPMTIYYDKITTDNVRFVISDYGKLISLSQFTDDYYKDSLVTVFSDNKYQSTDTVTIKIGFDFYNTAFDITSNF